MGERFTKRNLANAIEQWLQYGEQTGPEGSGAHKGYFSGAGWAATVLKSHLRKLKKELEYHDKRCACKYPPGATQNFVRCTLEDGHSGKHVGTNGRRWA